MATVSIKLPNIVTTTLLAASALAGAMIIKDVTRNKDQKCLSDIIKRYLVQQLKKFVNVNKKPKKIYLVRHGESQANINTMVYSQCPDNQIQLTDLGLQQADNVGARLKELIKNEKVKFYLSPYSRTQQTFDQIIRNFDQEQISVIEDPRIREQEWGNYQHFQKDPHLLQQIMQEREKVGKFYYRFPNGESGADLYNRVLHFWQNMFEDYQKQDELLEGRDECDNIVIVTHGAVLKTIIMIQYQLSVQHLHQMKNPENCELIALELNETGTYDCSNAIYLPQERNKKSKN